MRLIFLDTETPNRKNDRICEIGIIVREEEEVIFEKAWLVNPETNFDAVNMEIHNISKQDILNAPVFPSVWKQILNWLSDDTVFVMHNGNFDLKVIYKTLSAYKIQMNEIKYFCTMKKCVRSGLFESVKLNEIMNRIGKTFIHHEALNDAKACSCVYDYLANNVGWDEADMRTFKPHSMCANVNEYGSEFYHSIKNLEGILLGIVSDGIVQDEEVEELKRWVIENECNRSKLGFDACLNMMSQELEKTITISKCKEMYEWLSCHEEDCHEDTYSLEEWHGILRGIIADGIILRSELEYLIEWMEQRSWIDSNADSIYEECLKVFSHGLNSGEISDVDNQKLINLFKSELTDENSKNILLVLNQKICCLTGTFVSGRKKDIEARIVKAGGACSSSVTTKTNYVFIGGEGSRDYCDGNHGTKVNRALELKSKGQDINIFEEKILIASLEYLNV